MNEQDKDKIISRYSSRLATSGYSAETLGWGKKDRRKLRFQVLASHWDLNGSSVLDFGCGFGDFYGYAKDEGLNIEYTGVDLNPDLIEQGKKVFPGALLLCADIFKEQLPADRYDFIFSSGTHNTKIDNNETFIEATFEAFKKYVKKGFALNFISDRAEVKYPDVYYSSPVHMLELCYKYSKRVALRNDYMPFEFTVFVDLRDVFDNPYTVYPDYLKYV